MKKVLGFLFAIILFTSCSKQDNFMPQTQAETGTPLFYRDAYLAVTSFTANAVGASSIKLDFSTLYEKNISKIELLSGTTPNTLCVIYSTDINTNSSQLKNYNYIESNPKSSTMYYLIRYELNNGDWGFTDILKYQAGGGK
ncbi:MAG: hypothetical protein LC134_06220 [Chitinophagales bacterium]|nr:hypothetical protein [Chitinophagales bacterium]